MKRLRFKPVETRPLELAYAIKFFPDSRPGRGGPFPNPAPQPPLEPLPTADEPHSEGYFPAWVKYFVALVGGALERLNGLQFDIDKNESSSATNMKKELEDLEVALSGKKTKPPGKLNWPLAGPYNFQWHPKDAEEIGYATLAINLFFENEPDYRMVVNCTVELRTTDSPGEPISSSSSYLATSSSG